MLLNAKGTRYTGLVKNGNSYGGGNRRYSDLMKNNVQQLLEISYPATIVYFYSWIHHEYSLEASLGIVLFSAGYTVYYM